MMEIFLHLMILKEPMRRLKISHLVKTLVALMIMIFLLRLIFLLLMRISMMLMMGIGIKILF